MGKSILKYKLVIEYDKARNKQYYYVKAKREGFLSFLEPWLNVIGPKYNLEEVESELVNLKKEGPIRNDTEYQLPMDENEITLKDAPLLINHPLPSVRDMARNVLKKEQI